MQTHSKQERVLRTALGANAVFSGFSGLALAAGHPYLAHWMGLSWPLALMGIGLGLILFAGHIIYLLHRPAIERGAAAWIVVGDLSWVAASAALLWMVPHWFNGAGRIAVVSVAVIVLLFAEWQAFGMWKLYRKEPAAPA